MAQLKAKAVHTLKVKDESIPIRITNAIAVFSWKSAADLDLMASILKKDGTFTLVFSDKYPGGNMGSLGSFPFVMLDKDAGLGGVGGDNQEVIQISQIDPTVQSIELIVVNYQDAVANKPVNFGTYDGVLTLGTDAEGVNFQMAIDSNQPGFVCHVATIDNSGQVPRLVKRGDILTIDETIVKIPGFKVVTD